MTNEEFYNYMMEKLDQQLAIVEKGILESNYQSSDNTWNRPNGDNQSHLLDASTPLNAIEMATRCVNGNKQHMVDFRNNPNFKNDLMTRVMQTVKNCRLNDNKHHMLEAVKYCPEVSIEYVSDRLKEDPQFLLEAIEANREVAELKVVKDFQAENPGFAKQVEKRLQNQEKEQTPREAKEAKLVELQGEDARVTEETQQVKAELGINDKETSRDD